MIVLREKYSIPTLQMRKPSLRSCSEHIVMDHTVHKTLLSCEEFILCSLGLGLQSTLGQREEHVTQTWPIRVPHHPGSERGPNSLEFAVCSMGERTDDRSFRTISLKDNISSSFLQQLNLVTQKTVYATGEHKGTHRTKEGESSQWGGREP